MRYTRESGKAAPLIIGLVAFLAALAGLWVGSKLQSDPEPPQLANGMILAPPKPLQPFALVDHNGEVYDLARMQGHWTFMFFGYTHCPDVCPDTMSVLNLSLSQLKDQPQAAQDARVVFVSVDPKRDTAQQLAAYVPYFNERFLGVTGEPGALEDLTRQLGILYVVNDDGPEYTVDHSASILLMDPAGRMAAVFSGYPHDPREIAANYLKVRQHYQE